MQVRFLPGLPAAFVNRISFSVVAQFAKSFTTKGTKVHVLLGVLSVAVFVISQTALAQSGSNVSAGAAQPPSTMAPDRNSQTMPISSQQIFSGKIVKSGSKLVLTDSGTTYQLDDQQRAQEFLNKTVKVTGVLDTGAGTIRVSADGASLIP